MFKTVLATEFAVNRKFLVLAGIANVFFFLVLGTAEEPDIHQFIGVTFALFLIKLTIAAISAGDQKLTRLYMQLPVTATQLFLASWTFVLLWLSAQVLVWLLFGLVWDDNLASTSLVLAAGLSLASMIVIVSIGIDLINFRPKYVLWGYIATVLVLIALSVHADTHFAVISFDAETRVFPFGLLTAEGSSPIGWFAAVTLFAALWFADYQVFRHSDHYLS